MEYNDKNVEQFIIHESKFWNIDGYHLRVKYDIISDSSINAGSAQERIIKHTIPINVDGYILPKTKQEQITYQKIGGIKNVVTSEQEMTLEEFRGQFK